MQSLLEIKQQVKTFCSISLQFALKMQKYRVKFDMFTSVMTVVEFHCEVGETFINYDKVALASRVSFEIYC